MAFAAGTTDRGTDEPCDPRMQASLIASSMQALALQLSSAMCSRGNTPTLAEWAAVAGEAWACIDAETLVPKKSPLAAAPPVVPRRLSLQYEAEACMVRCCLADLSSPPSHGYLADAFNWFPAAAQAAVSRSAFCGRSMLMQTCKDSARAAGIGHASTTICASCDGLPGLNRRGLPPTPDRRGDERPHQAGRNGAAASVCRPCMLLMLASRAMQAVVSHAVIITSRPHQLKIGALTLEALRLSQALEWEAPIRNGKSAAACCPRSPRKLIFHQAGASRIHSALASTIDSMAPNKVLMIYLSADAWPFRPPPSPPPLHPSTPPASPQQPPHPGLVWTPAAVTLADTSVMLLAPVLNRQHAAVAGSGGASGPVANAADGTGNGDALTGLSASNSGVLMGTNGDTQETAAHTALAQILPSVQAGPEQWPKRAAAAAGAPSRHASSQALGLTEGDRDDTLEAAAEAAGAGLQGVELHDVAPARQLSHMSSVAGDDVAEGSNPQIPAAVGGGSDLLQPQLVSPFDDAMCMCNSDSWHRRWSMGHWAGFRGLRGRQTRCMRVVHALLLMVLTCLDGRCLAPRLNLLLGGCLARAACGLQCIPEMSGFPCNAACLGAATPGRRPPGSPAAPKRLSRVWLRHARVWFDHTVGRCDRWE